MRIYQLDAVNEDVTKPTGSFRKATAEDMKYMGEWYFAFSIECGVDHGKTIRDFTNKALEYINDDKCYVWDDGGAVATAAIGRRTKNSASVSMVYTPNHFRGKGYATACVTVLSRKLLEDGFSYSSLFTDLSNPTSNNIYQKIGYYPVCDYDEWIFEEPDIIAF